MNENSDKCITKDHIVEQQNRLDYDYGWPILIADFNDPQRLSPMKKENVKRSPSSYELHDTDFA